MRLVFIGPPGAGKGTQSKLLCEYFHIAHISTGDMLRDRIASGSATGLKAKAHYERGELVPDDLMVELVRERLAEPDCATGYLLDGFPRTPGQARALDRSLAAGGLELDAVIVLEVSDDEVVRRLSGRWTCSNPACGAVYNMATQPPKRAQRCDRCAAVLGQRDDDRAETIRRRLESYHAQTAPVIDYYRGQSLVRSVGGEGSVDEVQRKIRETLDQ